MRTFDEEVANYYSNYAESIARIYTLGKIGKELELNTVLEGVDCYVSLNLYSTPPEVEITLWSSIGMKENFELTKSTPLKLVVRHLLPKVHEFDKSFDETRNQLKYTAVYKDVRVVLISSPPNTCKIEKVEEEVEVPEVVTPVHTEKKVRYVMMGDCDPLLSEPLSVPVFSDGSPVTEPPPSAEARHTESREGG